jgi:hypothetical protein
MLNSETNIRNDIWKIFCTPATIIWDIENINMPKDIKVSDVKNELLALAKKHNADVEKFVVIGSAKQFRDNLKLEMHKNNFEFKHITSGRKNAADMNIIYYIMKLKDSNPPPYKIILITGDSDFTELISQLRDLSYEVILVHLKGSRKELIKAASHSVSWNDLLKHYLIIDKNEDDDVFTKTRTVSGSSILSSGMDTVNDLNYNAYICIVKFYTTDSVDYYSIPEDIKVNVGDIVKVEDSINYLNSWNIGKVIKVLDNPMFDNPELNVKSIIDNKYFNILLDEKKALDTEIFEICNKFHKDIINAELRWDKQNITIYYISDSEIDFVKLKYTLRKTYKISILTKSVTICPKRKCINRYCKFHHIKV